MCSRVNGAEDNETHTHTHTHRPKTTEISKHTSKDAHFADGIGVRVGWKTFHSSSNREEEGGKGGSFQVATAYGTVAVAVNSPGNGTRFAGPAHVSGMD